MSNTSTAIQDLDLEAQKSFSKVSNDILVAVTNGMLHDQITAAIEGGSNYWARIDVGKHEPGWANYFTAKFTVTETETSDEKAGAIQGHSYKLSIAKLLNGLTVLAAKYPWHFCDILKEEGDATTGDVLVQCALFGEIVYG